MISLNCIQLLSGPNKRQSKLKKTRQTLTYTRCYSAILHAHIPTLYFLWALMKRQLYSFPVIIHYQEIILLRILCNVLSTQFMTWWILYWKGESSRLWRWERKENGSCRSKKLLKLTKSCIHVHWYINCICR